MALTMRITMIGGKRASAAIAARSFPKVMGSAAKANTAAAHAILPFVKAEAPVRTSQTRNTTRVLYEGARAAVGPTTWYSHFSIGGTSRGVEPNPWVARGARKGRAAAKTAFSLVMRREVRKR